MEVTDYFEGAPEVSDYFGTSMNTPINTIGIHATLPDLTNKTGSMAPATIRIGKYYEAIEKSLGQALVITGDYKVIGQILEPTFLVGERYRIVQGFFNPENISALSSIAVSSQEKRNRRYVGYLSEFGRIWSLKKHQFTSLRKDFVWDQFKTTLDQLLQLKPEHLSFDLTDDLSIFFKAITKEYNLYLELFFEELDQTVESVVNIYRDGKVVLAYGGSIESTFNKIHELPTKNSKPIVQTAIPNAISSTPFATAEF
jgi:hypothetical protein